MAVSCIVMHPAIIIVIIVIFIARCVSTALLKAFSMLRDNCLLEDGLNWVA